MADLNDNEKKVVEAMTTLGATSEGNAKTADIIAGKCPFSKGMVNNILTQLQNKKVAKRVTKSKAGVYYLMQQQ
jgi:hypothetical protein